MIYSLIASKPDDIAELWTGTNIRLSPREGVDDVIYNRLHRLETAQLIYWAEWRSNRCRWRKSVRWPEVSQNTYFTKLEHHVHWVVLI